MREMAWDIHEVEIVAADQLHLRCFEEAVVVFAHESSVLNGFQSQVFDVCFRADNADIIWMMMLILMLEGNMLSNQHTNADTRHVKAVKEGLYCVVDLHTLPSSLVLQNSLSDGWHDTVVSSFYAFEHLCEAEIVILEFRWPVMMVIERCKVPPQTASTIASI